MSRVFNRLRSKIFAVLAMVLAASCLSTPSAHAADEPSVRDISAVRIDATDQLALLNMSGAVVRIYVNDPVYGPQTRTLAPMADTGETPMCAIPSDSNPDPAVHVTFNPDTPSAVTKTMWYYSISSSDYNLESRQQLVIKRAAAVVKMKNRVAKAKVAVKKAKAILKKAKASHREAWIRSASRWLAKTKAVLAKRKAKLAVRKTELISAKEDLRRLQEYTAYCQDRRLS